MKLPPARDFDDASIAFGFGRRFVRTRIGLKRSFECWGNLFRIAITLGLAAAAAIAAMVYAENADSRQREREALLINASRSNVHALVGGEKVLDTLARRSRVAP